MRTVLGGILAVVFVLVGLVLLVAAIGVSGLALCSDADAVRASGEDDCIEGGSRERALGLVLAYGSAIAAAVAVWLAVGFARGRKSGWSLTAAAVLTPVLALAAVSLLPVSF